MTLEREGNKLRFYDAVFFIRNVFRQLLHPADFSVRDVSVNLSVINNLKVKELEILLFCLMTALRHFEERALAFEVFQGSQKFVFFIITFFLIVFPKCEPSYACYKFLPKAYLRNREFPK